MRPRITYANVVSTLCLFVLIGGGSAYALAGSNTVFSDDIVNGEVKEADVGQGAVASPELKNDSIIAPDVAPNSLGGADVADNSLKSADVDEGSLAGALIPGIATSGLVKSSGLVTVDDPEGGQGTVRQLLTAGPFTVTGNCTDLGASGRASNVQIFSAADNWSFDSDADGGDDELTDRPAGAAEFIGFLADAGFAVTTPALDVGDYAAAAPNKLLTGEVLAGENIMGTDCVFGVTAIG